MAHYQPTSQFMGAAMIAEEYQITREDTDAFGLRSQQRAIAAWEAGHFEREVTPITAPMLDKEGKPTGATHTVSATKVCAQRRSKRCARSNRLPGQSIHTAGSSSQVSDGAAAVILASEKAVKSLGLKPRARIVATTLVGVDPVTMLKGPIPATTKVLAQAGLKIGDIDTFEVNEAFASVVLAWQRVHKPDPDRVNPNGGAIAIGHPTGSHRRATDHDRAAHARTHERSIRSDLDVLRRRPRHRHHHRADVIAMPAIRDELIELRGLRFYYRDWASAKPNAPTLVLLHGYTGHARSWDLVRRSDVIALSRAGARSARSRRNAMGAGRPRTTPAKWSPTSKRSSKRWASTNFALLGLSMGGLVSIGYAGKRPRRARKLVIVDIAPEIDVEGLKRIQAGRRAQRRVRLDRRSVCAGAHRQSDSAGRSAAPPRRSIR